VALAGLGFCARQCRKKICLHPGLSGVRCAANWVASHPAEKAALASGLRKRTTVSRRWLSARLAMGRYNNAAPEKGIPTVSSQSSKPEPTSSSWTRMRLQNQ
jgi:hypothetical protein